MYSLLYYIILVLEIFSYFVPWINKDTLSLSDLSIIVSDTFYFHQVQETLYPANFFPQLPTFFPRGTILSPRHTRMSSLSLSRFRKFNFVFML